MNLYFTPWFWSNFLFICFHARQMCICRVQYARCKEECREMDSLVGSGRIITAPIITEDGEPINDPLVLLEADQGKAQETTAMFREEARNNVILDKKIIQWKLTLHQIGRNLIYLLSLSLNYSSRISY